MTLEERIAAQTDRSGDCWVWTGGRAYNGYGQVSVRGHTRRAHRIAWELAHGPIAAGLQVCHHCDNPPCVRPDHLFLGTALDNHRDRAAKRREAHPRGETNPQARLTAADVLAMRARVAAGETRSELAVQYGVCLATVSKAVSGRYWRHLPNAIPVRAWDAP